MKTILLLGFLFSAPWPLFAAESAYEALRTIGRRDGKSLLDRIVEVRGRGELAQPPIWKVVIHNPAPDRGAREMEVQKGRVISERAMAPVSAPLKTRELNLDSTGALKIAKHEAEEAGMHFDRVDYLLKAGAVVETPVWALELFEGKLGRVALVEINADDAKVLRREFKKPASAASQISRPSSSADASFRTTEPSLEMIDFFKQAAKRFRESDRQLENFVPSQPAE